MPQMVRERSGFFEKFQNTTSGMDGFFSLRLKIKIYGKKKNIIQAYWRYI